MRVGGRRRVERSLIAFVTAVAISVPSSPVVGALTPANPPHALATAQAVGAMSWQLIPGDVALPGGRTVGLRLNDLAITPAGFVAVGGEERGGVVITSTDGVTWTRAADRASLDRASLTAVAVGRRQMLAVGTLSGSARGLLWRTTDVSPTTGAATWTGPIQAFVGSVSVADIAVGAPAWVVAGNMRLPADAQGVRRLVGAIWRSDDGRTWQRVRLPDSSVAGDYRLGRVAFVGSRYVVLGRRSPSTSADGVLVWTSTDGTAWRRGANIPVAADGEISDLGLTPSGTIVAVGVETWTPVTGIVVTSADGSAWQRAAGSFTAAVRGVSCEASGCTAVGGTTRPPVNPADTSATSAAISWVSTTGSSWSLASSVPASAAPSGSALRLLGVGLERVARRSGTTVALGWRTVPYQTIGWCDRSGIWSSPPVAVPSASPAPPVARIAGTWTQLAAMSTPHYGPVAAAARDGRIFVIGGVTLDAVLHRYVQVASVEIFDPSTGRWSMGTPRPGPLARPLAAVTAGDGRIYVFHVSGSRVSVLDPRSGAWSTAPSVPGARGVVSVSVRPDGRIAVTSWGVAGRSPYMTLDPWTRKWTTGTAGSWLTPRWWEGPTSGMALDDIRAWRVDTVRGTAADLAAAPGSVVLSGASRSVALGSLIWVRAERRADPPGYANWSAPMLLAYDIPDNRWVVGPTPPPLSNAAVAAVATGGAVYFFGSTTTSSAHSAWKVSFGW